MSAQILARLGPASPYRITLITGAVGSGKSEAIAGTVATMSARCAYFAPRRSQEQLVPFVRGVIEAFRGPVPALSVGFASAAAAARRSTRPALVLGDWFATHLGAERTVIALDDLHLLDEEPADVSPVRDFIMRAITASSPNIRWILGMRDTYRWPVSAWLAGSVAGIPIEFRGQGSSLSDEATFHDVRAWLATRSIEDRSTAGILSRLPSLHDEVLARVPAVRTLLSDLLRVIPYACSGERLRLSVADALASGDLTDDDRAVARRALDGAPSHEVIQYLTDLCDGDAIVDLLAREGFALIDAHYGDVVDRAVAILDKSDRDRSAIALLLKAVRETELGRHDVAESWYLHAIRIAPEPASAARVEFEFASDLLRRARHDCVDLLEKVEKTPVSPAFDARVAAALGAAYAVSDRWDAARDAIRRALVAVDAWPEQADLAVRARILRQAAYVHLLDNDPSLAATFARRAIELGERLGLDEIVAAALSVLLVVASSHDDDGDGALALLRRLESAAYRLDNAFLLRYARLGQLDAYGDRAAWGDVDRVEALLESQELENDILHTDETLVRTRALRAASLGDFVSALRLLGTSAEAAGSDAGLRALRHAETATYAAAAGERAKALAAIDEAQKILPSLSAQANALVVRTDLQLTLAMHALGRRRLARARHRAAESYVVRYPRLALLHATIGRLLDFGDEPFDARGSEIVASLAALRACGLGGFASVIAALPLELVVREAG